MKKIIFECDDEHPTLSCLSHLEKFWQVFPDFHMNFFVPAALNGYRISERSAIRWTSVIRDLIYKGKVTLAVHGLYHSPEEFKKIDKAEVDLRLSAAEQYFEEAELDFVKVFRGPHWGINGDTFEVLIDRGYTHVYSHTDYKELNDQFADKIKIVYYNWNLADPYPEFLPDEIVVAHTHSHNVCNNGVPESLPKMAETFRKHPFEFIKVDQI